MLALDDAQRFSPGAQQPRSAALPGSNWGCAHTGREGCARSRAAQGVPPAAAGAARLRWLQGGVGGRAVVFLPVVFALTLVLWAAYPRTNQVIFLACTAAARCSARPARLGARTRRLQIPLLCPVITALNFSHAVLNASQPRGPGATLCGTCSSVCVPGCALPLPPQVEQYVRKPRRTAQGTAGRSTAHDAWYRKGAEYWEAMAGTGVPAVGCTGLPYTGLLCSAVPVLEMVGAGGQSSSSRAAVVAAAAQGCALLLLSTDEDVQDQGHTTPLEGSKLVDFSCGPFIFSVLQTRMCRARMTPTILTSGRASGS